MLARSINRILKLVGVQLVRFPTSSYEVRKLAPGEKAEVDRILEQFTTGLQPGSELADRNAWRDYLSDHRISFFYDILKLLDDRNIQRSEKRIADFGSGTGFLLRLIQHSSPTSELTGIDSFAEVNLLAKLFCPEATLVATLEEVGDPYDLVFCTEVLEHLVDPSSLLARLIECVRPGGYLILTVPNGRTDTMEPLKMRDDGTAWWGHIHFWSPESWPLFLSSSLPEDAEIETGLMPSGENFAVIRIK